MKNILRVIINIFLIVFSTAVFADNVDLGKVAKNLYEPVSVLSELISTASIIIGVSFLFGALLRYMQYRQNPLAAPLGSVITLLIMGIVLILLPLVYLFTEGGIPYSYRS